MQKISSTAQGASSTRQAAMTGLAVVGFIALVTGGMYLAVYSARYVPNVAARIGAAAVSLSSVFQSSPPNNLSVVPTVSSTTISFGDSTSTPASTPAPAVSTPKPAPVATVPGPKSTSVSPIGTSTAPIAGQLHGYPDLIVTITSTGYLATTSTDSFVPGATVPSGMRPAVKFTIKNVGTNVAGSWLFSASIPTQTGFIFMSTPQQALNPGDSIDYTLGFDQARPGSQTISITANPNSPQAITENNSNNNSASANITILP